MNQNWDWLAVKEPIWIYKSAKFSKGLVQSIANDLVTCMLEDGTYAQAKKNLVFQRNPYNNSFDPERQDLMDMDVLNEPEILRTLKYRLENKRIYTFVENTLIVVNPYQPIPELTSSMLKDFYIRTIIEDRENIRDYEPHIYSITCLMISEMEENRKNQAIVISGESGAGKTESNKECLRLLTYYFGKYQQKLNTSAHKNERVQNIIEMSNPILEAFGNSKTIRNNNSSRFGKFLNVLLDQKNQIRHAQIYNYLLQKSRIISRAPNQQNFHIFYEFIKHLSPSEKLKYHIIDSNQRQLKFSDFNYLKTEGPFKYEAHPDVSFDKVKKSLEYLNDKSSYDFACRIIAAVLFLGNLEPYENQKEDKCSILPQDTFQNVCSLLLVNKKTLLNSLTSYSIKIGGQTLNKSFGHRQVQELISSLAKVLYQKLFQWIIMKLNEMASMETSNQQLWSLGFLDIYGFQILQNNSLEQLFINYTNQRLHQIYLKKIFKEEKAQFEEENLIHKFRQTDFQDNVKIIELIDYENLSIFNLLDQWCSVASPDQGSFITKIRYNHKKNQYFPPSNFNLPSTLFILKHSPKQIQYNVAGFREKNKDLLRQQIKETMKTSKITNLSKIFEESSNQNDPKNHKVRKFLSLKFRKEMNSLVDDILSKSELHFVRCIKSNNEKKPLTLDDEVVFNQICYLGILDTIKVKKMGYCTKLTYQTIDKRFKWLVRFYFQEAAFPKQIQKAFSQFLPRFGQDQILYGRERVFFKDYAYSTLVKKYAIYLQDLKLKCHKVITALVKNRYFQKKMKKLKSIKQVQRYILPYIYVKRKNLIIQNIKLVQRTMKKFMKLTKIKRKLDNITTISIYAKRLIEQTKKNKKLQAIGKITKFLRGVLFKRKFKRYMFCLDIIKNVVFEKVWRKISMKNKYILQKYMLSFVVQISKRQKIEQANMNTLQVVFDKNVKLLKQYLKGFSIYLQKINLIKKIIRIQSFIRGAKLRKKYLNLKKSVILIQRAFREYRFNKKIAKDMFTVNFQGYQENLQNQNSYIQSILYYGPNQNGDTLEILYKNYLSKFKQKFSLLFFMIDFQSFVNLDIIYPDGSWFLNYFHIMKESLDKDNPLQHLEIGQTFTVATTTNKIYLWGMNTEFNTLENVSQIKVKGQIQKIELNRQKIQIKCEGSKVKDQIKIFSTVNRAFNLQNGKLFECCEEKLKIIKLPVQSQRVVEVACGQSHVILRSSSKKVYTFGNGKQGQLGHGNFAFEDQPKMVKFPQSLKGYHPIQVASSFSSSIVLFSNKKIVWFGKNGTINKVNTPTLFDIRTKSDLFGSNECVPVKLHSSWSRNVSTISLTFLSFNSLLSSNLSLRSKLTDLLISKWHEADIARINPPYAPAISDYLEQIHVKIPNVKVNIEPEGRRIARELEEKVKSFTSQRLGQISFSDYNKGDFFR